MSFTPINAEENPNQKRIDEIESQIKVLQSELKELKGDENSEDGNDAPGLGETQTVDAYEITINEVSFTDERNNFDDSDPDNVIRIDYTIKNNADEDVSYSGNDFKVYVDGKETSIYPNDNSVGALSAGRSLDGVAHHVLEGDGEVEIDWSPLSYFGKEKAIFKIDRADIQ
ncbi:DUF4352 domain-containing protein [Aerococcaceae bacterium DSM 111020]|nr:DUF4352 domain-containing protein [Aerococcaceae bacterium DSM 111020]